jgi:hypothetical protein
MFWLLLSLIVKACHWLPGSTETQVLAKNSPASIKATIRSQNGREGIKEGRLTRPAGKSVTILRALASGLLAYQYVSGFENTPRSGPSRSGWPGMFEAVRLLVPSAHRLACRTVFSLLLPQETSALMKRPFTHSSL